jgi:hypothetical protein
MKHTPTHTHTHSLPLSFFLIQTTNNTERINGCSFLQVSFLEKDDLLKTKREFLAQIDTAMGGRVAEEIIYGPDFITQGQSSSHLQKLIPTQYPSLNEMNDINVSGEL